MHISTSSPSSANTVSKQNPLMMNFAAKKTLFYANLAQIQQGDVKAVYDINNIFVREFEAMIVLKTRDPLNLFYVKSYGTLEITGFIKELNLGPGFSRLKNNIIPISETRAFPANVAFSIMSHNPLDLKGFLFNLSLKNTMIFYHTFLQMMLNLLNGLIIMHFEFYHCDLKPLNIMF
jgi:hypothetical protein